jgi:hypothetical protein
LGRDELEIVRIAEQQLIMAAAPLDPAKVVLERVGHSLENTYAALCELSGVPASTLWHRDHRRVSIQQRAAKQQYLSPQEEKALVSYLLRMSANGYPLPVKFAGNLAYVIVLRRSSIFQIPATDRNDVHPPGKNWPQAFYKRHPELKAMRMKAIDWDRHDHYIHEKVVEWFSVIGKELASPVILPENTWNMDETGVLLSILNSLKVLVGRHELKTHRGAGVKRTLITAIECISADGRYLPPLIIWPAATHRSTWTTHPTLGWHFGHSDSGYTDTAISLYWIQHVFDPLTKARAGQKPRVLINDGFGTYKSLELMKFCFENNIILCRLPSHTSYKLQPCDVGIFGLLKIAYREEVERLYRGGSNMIGKQHFTLLYGCARRKAMNSQNIISGWSKTGLRPFNPERVLKEVQKPQEVKYCSPLIIDFKGDDILHHLKTPETPKTFENLVSLRKNVEISLTRQDVVDTHTKLSIQKGDAAENAFAERAILLDENLLLFEQNNEKTTRTSMKATVVGTAKVLSYEDIVEAQQKRDMKDAETVAVRGRRISKRSGSAPSKVIGKRTRSHEREEAIDEIRASCMEIYCSVLKF